MAVIFAQTLKTLGLTAQAFRGGQAGIRTDGVFGNARIVGINPIALQKSLQAGVIPVVCGFQGVFISEHGMPGANSRRLDAVVQTQPPRPWERPRLPTQLRSTPTWKA